MARQLGSTALGIQTSEGVLLAVEKRITSTLMEPSSIEKIVEVDAHIGAFSLDWPTAAMREEAALCLHAGRRLPPSTDRVPRPPCESRPPC